jgi:hydrogenase maturation factor
LDEEGKYLAVHTGSIMQSYDQRMAHGLYVTLHEREESGIYGTLKQF